MEATSGASDLSYGFLQTSMSSGADLAKFEAVRLVRDLAQKQRSAALAQLAQRMAVAIRAGGSSADPYLHPLSDAMLFSCCTRAQ